MDWGLRTIRRHWAITGIIVAFIALSATYSVVTPIFEASDELWHYPFVKHLADGNGLPVQDASADQPWRQEGSQPPLYYALSALATFWIDTDDAYEGHPPLLWHNPHVDNGLPTADGNINLVVHSQQEAFPWHGTALAVHLIRLLSVLMGAATVLLTYLIALEVFPGRQNLALGAAAVNAFTPMFLFISGAVNNDNLVAPLCSLALLMMVKVANHKSQIANRNWSLVIGHWSLGFVLGLAALTKESALGLFPLALLAVAIRIWPQYHEAPFFKRVGLVIGHWSREVLLHVIPPALAVSGWWYWRNWRLYGDPLGLNVFLDIVGRRHPPATLGQLWGEREGFAMSYWGLFGGLNVPLDTWVYRLLNLLAIAAALGMIIFLIRKLIRDRLRLEAWGQVVILLAWPTIVFASLIRWALQTPASQGRLLFSAISALSILLFLGLSQFVPRRCRFAYTKTLACLVGGLMLVIAAIAPFRYIAPAYTKPSLLSSEEIGAIPNRLDISFGGTMKLLGYNLQPVTCNLQPGDSLAVTLYWQSLAEMDQNYSTFVHLLDENELVIAQRDMYPGQGLYPTSLWSVGDTIANRYVLTLPETAFAPNQAQLEVGLYDFATGERTMAYGPDEEPLGDNARFHQIEILPRAETEIPNPLNFNFGNRIALIGYDLDRRTASPGEIIHLTLYWRALAKMTEDYTVFTHVLGEENRIWAQKDSWPQGGNAPTSTWEPGQTIADEYKLVFDSDTPLGVYDVEIGWYLAATGERLRIVGQGGRLLNDHVLLSRIRVANRIPPTPTADCCPIPAVLTLDTGWRFRTDPDDVGLTEGWPLPTFDDANWEVLAPGEAWECSGLEYDGVAWYRTQVTLPDWPAVHLGFGRVDDVVTLWVEGDQVPVSEGLSSGYVFLDLLTFGQPGDQLHLALRVEDRGGYGGIKQPLRLGCEPRLVMNSAQYVTWLADSHPAWPMPAWARGRPVAWTMAGQLNAADEALLSADGAVAPWATAPTAEVWLYDPASGELACGAQNDVRFSLANDHLPIPQWEWEAFGVTLKNTLFGDPFDWTQGQARDSAVRWQVTAHNVSDTKRELTLLVTVRPLAVNWGMAPIYAIDLQDKTHLRVNGEPFMVATTPPEEAGVGLLEEVMRATVQGRVPDGETITSAPAGDAAAVWAYPLNLDAGQSTALSFAFPAAPGAPFPDTDSDAQARLAETIAAWEKATGRVTLDLPDDLMERGVSASLGYLLLALDPDGPHPGPLAHDALWVRDAAYIGLGLLQFGHADAVRDYIPAVLSGQEADGRVPPIQGENILWDDDEWDAQGQAIFLVTSYYRYTGDQETLRQWYPALRSAARFIAELRASQTDPSATLRTGSAGPAQGLLPPSKSAEDLGPSDWHHYWDDFWAVAGLEEAAYAAHELGEPEDAAWMLCEADALREAILASVEAVMGADPAYIPGAVENVEDSAMARGTVPALWPVEVLPREMPLLTRSFDHYHQLWVAPYEGAFRHHGGQFWPYGGLQMAHAYLRLGRKDVLHQILGWTLTHQTLPGTFAWAEQVNPTDGGLSGGDMPHAWAAASYATLIREMLVSEYDDAAVSTSKLELFSSVPHWWLGAGQVIALENAPTHFGEVNLRTESTVQQTDATWNGTLTLTLSGAAPPGGFRWRLPHKPAAVDGPPGTAIVNGWLVVPGQGGTVQLTFTSDFGS